MDLDKREQLDVDGFCIIPNLLPPALLARIQAESNRILEALPKEHEQDNRSTGSMVSVYESPVFAELIALPEAQAASWREVGMPAISGWTWPKKPPSWP